MSDKIERGKVIFMADRGEASFGFICPEGCDVSRQTNVWFGIKATGGRMLRKGQEVSFIYFRLFKEGPAAYRVWPADEEAPPL